MQNSVLVAIAAWLFPGAGHALKGSWTKAIVVGGVVWTMFAVAIVSGGAYYPGLEWEEGQLLYLLNVFARLGNVFGAMISWTLSMNPPPNVAEWATFEYGGRLLEVAGLVNYLAVFDALGFTGGDEE
ncbi:MAG: hypothetical protein HKN33_05395 [Pyrinomonadaceae bacterium]|nr:hypothetical protein [Pyrinomonadaceae bacterium]